MDSFDEGDQFDNLWINNSWEDDAVLDQYENEIDKNLNEHLQYEKEQCTQKLFQSFQSSACAVTQMFKDRTQIISPWNSFQNAAGAITVLYKESLDSCKVHLDMGINMGQQRKIKELINWLRKKKRRTIRKDDLVNFLIGRQTTTAASSNQRFSSFNRATSRSNRNNTNNVVSSSLIGSNNMMMINTASNVTNTNVNNNGTNDATSTHSDLATFREALIMHNRTRDMPPINTTNAHLNHHHSHQHAANTNTTTSTTTITSPTTNTTTNTNTTTTTTTTGTNPNCDDLDCFFCEQIARHIEHKRSATSAEMDSPTRKRSRFY